MTDTEILDRMEKAGISVWPDRESRVYPDAKISHWNTFCRNPKDVHNPVQTTRTSLRVALLETFAKLDKP